jgi:replicative DNA helicase
MREKALPSNFEAEQLLLGTILYMPDTRFQVMDRLQASDFYHESHRHRDIFEVMHLLHVADIQISIVTVLDYLRRRDITEIYDRTARSYLTDLHDLAFHEGPYIDEYAKPIRNAAMRRNLLAFLQDAARIVGEEEDGEAALEHVERLLHEMTDNRASTDLLSDTEIMASFLAQMEQGGREYGQVVGIPTGFFDLDALLGGMQRQELYVLGGRPGTGKTSFLLNVIYYMLFKLGLRIALFSLEMSKEDLARRLVSMDTGINSQLLRSRCLSDEQYDALVHSATEHFSTDRLYVDESGSLSIDAIRTKARRHKMRHGLDIVMVDYLQLMSAGGTGQKGETRTQEIGRISRGLKQLARELDVPVFALAALNRAVEGRQDKKPQLPDLRESGSIESDADVIMFLSLHESIPNHTIIGIPKHRNGPTGEVTLWFERALTKFHDVEVA